MLDVKGSCDADDAGKDTIRVSSGPGGVWAAEQPKGIVDSDTRISNVPKTWVRSNGSWITRQEEAGDPLDGP